MNVYGYWKHGILQLLVREFGVAAILLVRPHLDVDYDLAHLVCREAWVGITVVAVFSFLFKLLKAGPDISVDTVREVQSGLESRRSPPSFWFILCFWLYV